MPILVTSRRYLTVAVAPEISSHSPATQTHAGLNLVKFQANHPQEVANRATDSQKDRLAKVEVAERGG